MDVNVGGGGIRFLFRVHVVGTDPYVDTHVYLHTRPLPQEVGIVDESQSHLVGPRLHNPNVQKSGKRLEPWCTEP